MSDAIRQIGWTKDPSITEWKDEGSNTRGGLWYQATSVNAHAAQTTRRIRQQAYDASSG